jgi:non-lysosomal glucosylceramidase
MAFVAGLGYIADAEKVDKAIAAIYEHNFIPNLRDFHNVQRVYGLNDEAGVVLCTWPHGDRPALPFVYSDEIWTGVEFQVAASLIYTGRVEEGLEIVQAVQDRYDGMKRNPFEHLESGVHYSRALAAWSVLLALSGFDYDGIEKIMTFAPAINGDNFRSFWSTGTAWGNVTINDTEAIIGVLYGTLKTDKIMIRQAHSGRFTVKEFEKGNTIHQGGLIKLDFK